MTIEQLVKLGRQIIGAIGKTTSDEAAQRLHKEFVDAYLKCAYADATGGEMKAAIMLSLVSQAFLEHCSTQAMINQLNKQTRPQDRWAYA